jgi:hypothetical protein
LDGVSPGNKTAIAVQISFVNFVVIVLDCTERGWTATDDEKISCKTASGMRPA